MATPAEEIEGSGEGYFASISDLMVGVLFIFLLMLTVFAINFRSAESDTRQLEEQLRRALAETSAERERNRELTQRINRQRQQLLRALELLEVRIETRSDARDRMLARIERQLEQRGITVQVDARSGVLRLGERELRFATRSAELSADAQATTDALATVLADVLPCFAHGGERRTCAAEDSAILEAVLIEGHTDRRPIGGGSRFRDNSQLSAERALTVFRRMIEVAPALRGLANAELQPLLAVAGYGESRLIRSGNTEEDHAVNRRIDLRFVLSAPGTEEIQRLSDEIRRMLDRDR